MGSGNSATFLTSATMPGMLCSSAIRSRIQMGSMPFASACAMSSAFARKMEDAWDSSASAMARSTAFFSLVDLCANSPAAALARFPIWRKSIASAISSMCFAFQDCPLVPMLYTTD